MIKYKLVCKDCNILFDSWFASSKEYEKLKKKNFLSCHNCNSFKVEKTIMAPKVINNSKVNIDKKEINFKDISKKIKEYQKFIKKNFKYVGENFAYEARSIHYNNKKKVGKGIFGTASSKEIKELKEEGIETEMIPWVEEKN